MKKIYQVGFEIDTGAYFFNYDVVVRAASENEAENKAYNHLQEDILDSQSFGMVKYIIAYRMIIIMI